MKKNYVTILAILLVASISLISAYQMDDDPDGEAGATGAPGEVTCADADCHATYDLNSGPGSIVISSPDLINWEYTPGQSYTISVTVSQTDIDLFGLGFVALKSNGDNAGLLIPGSDNQIKSKNILGFSRKNIVHDDNTGASSDSHTFTFTWNAPSSNVGDVTFYAAGNAANGDDHEDDDYVYTTSQVVSVAVGIYESELLEADLGVYPNPVSDVLNINARISEPGFVEFSLFDNKGALVSQLTTGAQGISEMNHALDVSELPDGAYTLQMNVGGKPATSINVHKK